MAEKKPADGLEMPTRPVYAKLVSLANMRDNSPSSLVKVAQLARVSLAQNYLDGYNNQVDEPKNSTFPGYISQTLKVSVSASEANDRRKWLIAQKAHLESEDLSNPKL